MDENWLPVVGFEGLYEVSDCGRVRSRDKVWRTRGAGTALHRGKEMSVFPDADGYLRVTLRRDGKRIQRGVHQLVAEAFIGSRPPGMETMHGDGDRKHNRRANLSWGTGLDNAADRERHGNTLRGEINPIAKLTAAQVLAIRADTRMGTHVAIAYGVTPANISSIKHRKSWAHL